MNKIRLIRAAIQLDDADVTDEDLEGGGAAGDGDASAAARSGRFRVSSANAGPPETTLGRFRLIPQGITVDFLFHPFV